ncbi:MAG: hypothetical protein D4R43_00425 [Sphingobacteriales bacterium]|nr:MAG: hypothetical protein D4R43_00425 [Sphingobacteriales bacterium]
MKSKIFTTLLVLISFSTFATTHIFTFGGSLGDVYSPILVNVLVGDTVTWNGDFASHPLESMNIPAGAASFVCTTGTTFSYAVLFAGDYFFRCDNHSTMTGQIKASTPSSVKITESNNDISIYPTSVQSFLKIKMPSAGKSYVADVKNILCQTVQHSELANGGITTVDLSNIYNGIYFVAIRNDLDVVKVVRIVKE